ncbi:MAG: Rid family hydrolase [Steroidobacteraceae bacterium]|jgi:enamine deaminase RidA (YjgF/YER057c/UK114 family)|nr:Rid family hydrolase [Steroidobacteraceae bacterium]
MSPHHRASCLAVLVASVSATVAPAAAAQPNVPARTTVQVVALPIPGTLVEIEVIAARTVARP